MPFFSVINPQFPTLFRYMYTVTAYSTHKCAINHSSAPETGGNNIHWQSAAKCPTTKEGLKMSQDLDCIFLTSLTNPPTPPLIQAFSSWNCIRYVHRVAEIILYAATLYNGDQQCVFYSADLNFIQSAANFPRGNTDGKSFGIYILFIYKYSWQHENI